MNVNFYIKQGTRRQMKFNSASSLVCYIQAHGKKLKGALIIMRLPSGMEVGRMSVEKYLEIDKTAKQ